MKTLKLKYGEYYSLKITDSGKNVINNVEITGNQITTEQSLFSSPSYDKNYMPDQEEYIKILMKGETRLQDLLLKREQGTITFSHARDRRLLKIGII